MTAIDLDGLAPLPPRVARLGELALDLWWTWNPNARQVFRRLDYTLWRATDHNPVRMLRLLPATRLANAARDPLRRIGTRSWNLVTMTAATARDST